MNWSPVRFGGIAILVLLGATATTQVRADDASSAASALPSKLLASSQSGSKAIAGLGSNIAEAARRNRLTEQELRKHLADPHAFLNQDGRLFYVDEGVDPVAAAAVNQTSSSGDSASAAAPALADPALVDPVTDTTPDTTFLLHSRRSAHRVIYLDFTGGTISGTAWNDDPDFATGPSFYADPYDTDAQPSTFSASERRTIQRVWARVSEDYATFDIDVTTEPPTPAAIDRAGLADQDYGTRLMVTNATAVYSVCGCGGVAYVGVYDEPFIHSYFQPAFVFQRAGLSNDKYLAEAASHEVGHNLGLSHDGTATLGYYTGQGVWAPIMGVSYYRPLSQFSRGEYAGANNTEDDFTVMQSFGAPRLADDFPDTVAAAFPLTTGSSSDPNENYVQGLISSATDVDMFRVSVPSNATSLTINALPAALSPDLDIKFSVYTAGGTLLSTIDPGAAGLSSDSASGLDASTTLALPAGADYVVGIRGASLGSPSVSGYSTYGSVGQYRLQVRANVPAAPQAPSSGGGTAMPDSTTSQAPVAPAANSVPTTLAALAAPVVQAPTPSPAPTAAPTVAVPTSAVAVTPVVAVPVAVAALPVVSTIPVAASDSTAPGITIPGSPEVDRVPALATPAAPAITIAAPSIAAPATNAPATNSPVTTTPAPRPALRPAPSVAARTVAKSPKRTPKRRGS